MRRGYEPNSESDLLGGTARGHRSHLFLTLARGKAGARSVVVRVRFKPVRGVQASSGREPAVERREQPACAGCSRKSYHVVPSPREVGSSSWDCKPRSKWSSPSLG